MARRRKPNVTKKIVIIGLVLIAIQGVYLVVFGGKSKPIDVREAITKAVDQKTALSVEAKERAKIQLAITDFMTKNGQPPKALDELVPTYFDILPNNPTTGKPFKYRVDGMHFYVGEETAVAAATSVSGEPGVAPVPGEPATAEEKLALLEQLNENTAKSGYIYDPTGKRDPFRPYDIAPKQVNDASKTPLERYNLGELKLTAVLKGFDGPTAIVENAAGKGFSVKKGTKIGNNGGEVVEILPDKLLILETEIDFTGEKKTRTLELRLRTKDQDNPR
ncbi:MAG: pilus assembly protein PilP [Oligoflexia bacterium]|nr:pilus assembly protein PilP [Oligoflexia bacterium]